MTPTLQSARLMLVPHRSSLVTDQQVAWLNDPLVVRYSEQRHTKHTLESQHIYLNGFPQDSHIWLIRVGEKDIGTINAYVDKPNKVANMGILIGDRNAQRLGCGSEAWETVMKFLFSVGIRKIEAGCMSVNRPMVHLAEKTGMEIEAVVLEHFLHNGKPVSKFIMAAYR